MFRRKPDNFPYEVNGVDSEAKKKVSRFYTLYLWHLIRVGPEKMTIPYPFIDNALYYRDFPLRENDVIVMGHQRSGTTMTAELLWLVFNNFNFKMAAETTKNKRVPILGMKSFLLPILKVVGGILGHTEFVGTFSQNPENLEKITCRRVIKTHLHFNFLPENLLTRGCKIVYLARNPKDVIVSNYHYRPGLRLNFLENFESFVDLFISDLFVFGPYWTHLRQAWEHRSSPNVLFIFYEDFLQNRRQYMEKILEFVGEKVTPFQLDLLDFIFEFENFKKYMAQDIDQKMYNNRNVNADFVRKGRVGGWKKYFTEEVNMKVDKWIEENLAQTGIEFPEGVL